MIVFTSLSDPKLREMLQNGAVGVLPTDTIYGLAASASNKQAVARLYQLKAREHKPGTIIAANATQLIELGVHKAGVEYAARLWPNPLSIVIDADRKLAYLDQEVGSLAVRVPADDAVCKLLQATGPLVTSSANHPGDPPANDVAAAQQIFGDLVDFYVDGGDYSDRPASTVVRLLPGGTFETLRKGAITLTEKGVIV